MERFGVPENEIARWAGFTSAIFSLCQAFTGLIWGAASDYYGRKPIILVGLFNTMLTMLLWGFSTNLPMAMTARALQGLGNGNVGILRTTVAELCPWKELQPRAFSVMPLVYTVGAIIGPTLGGALSNPLGIDPRAHQGDRFLEVFPYCLPNIVAAVFFAVGIIVGWLFLQETLESKKLILVPFTGLKRRMLPNCKTNMRNLLKVSKTPSTTNQTQMPSWQIRVSSLPLHSADLC